MVHGPGVSIWAIASQASSTLRSAISQCPAAELGEGEVGEALSAPDVFAALAIPPFLDLVASTSRVEVVDAVEVDEREEALLGVGPGPFLARTPLRKQLRLLAVAAERLGPGPVEVHRCERRGVVVGIERSHRRAGALRAFRLDRLRSRR